MMRAGAGALVAIAVTAALTLRVARLDVRPMHHDEANQAVKFGALLERGEYHYDAHDHHGPTLYFLSLPAASLRGQTTLASLDEWTLRSVPVFFGVATLLLLPLLAPGIGWTAVAAGMLLLAVSPAMVFYSRMFIQESLFACFTLAFVIATGRAAMGDPGTVPTSGTVPTAQMATWTMRAGIAAGLAIATKETSAIVLPAALAACAIAWHSLGSARPTLPRTAGRWVAGSVVAAAAVAALFYSSFFTYVPGVLEPFRGIGTYIDRGIDTARHAHPWYYYLGLLAYSSSGGLTWSEALVLGLALVGTIAAWRRPEASHPERAFWIRYLAGYAAITVAIFSAIPYKTPWNLLPFYAGVIALAGIGLSILLFSTASRVLRTAVVAAFLIGCGHLGSQAWRASVVYAADPRNPYVYAQTVPDTLRMVKRIHDLAGVHHAHERMQVSVIAPPYEQWPLPWYLRRMPIVGYWQAPDDALALQAPVIVASMQHTAALDAALGDRYLSEYYGLRPDVLLALYVERGLWASYLARVADGTTSEAKLERVARTERAGLRPCSTGDEPCSTPAVGQDFSPAQFSPPVGQDFSPAQSSSARGAS